MSSKKNILTMTIVAVLTLLVVISGLTYAYFAGIINNSNTVNAIVTMPSTYFFTSLSGNNLVIDLAASDMPQANVGNVAATNNASISAQLYSGSDSDTTICSYDVIFVWDSEDTYTTPDKVLSFGEYEFSVQEGSVPLDETDLSSYTFVNNQTVLFSDSIYSHNTSSPTIKKYEIKFNIHNIDVDQDNIEGKDFAGHIQIVNVDCEVKPGIIDELPKKGQLINVDLNGDDTIETYRVIKQVDEETIEMMYMGTDLTGLFGSNEEYDGSTLDTYLNTWYDSLTTTAKDAIVDNTFYQDEWAFYSGYELHEYSYALDPKYFGKRLSQDGFGYFDYAIHLVDSEYSSSLTRSVYVLGLQDILDYLGTTTNMSESNTTLNAANLSKLFYIQETSENTGCWLRSVKLYISHKYIYIYSAYSSYTNFDPETMEEVTIVSHEDQINYTHSVYNTNAYEYRPTMQIKINKLNWN